MKEKLITILEQRTRALHQNSAKPILKSYHWLAVGTAFIVIGLLLGATPDSAEATRTKASVPLVATGPGTDAITLPLQLPEARIETTADQPTQQGSETAQWRTFTVQRGDTLSAILTKAGVNSRELHNILSLGEETRMLTRLFPGETLKLKSDPTGQLQELLYESNPTNVLHVQRNGEGFEARKILHPVERRIAHATATITSSLFNAAQDAGLSDNLAMELADIFGWDIDFALDLRQGDHFSIVHEEFYLEGTKIGDGAILAAAFTNQGKTYRALRYTDAKGNTDYYTPEGLGMRKAFLRTPLEFSRISSRFSLKRYHPILKEVRAHKGIDYAAPIGTPVKAAGNARVTFAGHKSGYGNVIILQHGERYSTVYGHLKNFARGIKAGARVSQGQVIGYVGKTGLATGPHLHYEFRVNGVHRNPLTVALPNADPIPANQKSSFLQTTRPMLTQLEVIDRMAVALGTKAANTLKP